MKTIDKVSDLCDEVFFAVYSHVLKTDGGAKNEVSLALLFSTLPLIAFLQLFVLLGVVLLVGEFEFEFEHKWYGVTVALIMLSVNSLFYLWNDRYKRILSKYFGADEDEVRAAKRRAGWIVAFIVVQFFALAALRISQLAT